MPRMFHTLSSSTSSLDHQLADAMRLNAADMTHRRTGQPVVDNRARLMIADDDVVVRTMLTMALREHFVVVGHAADGEQAVDLARTTRPDVALVDVEMPKGGGLHAVQGITQQAPETAVVMLSIDEEDSVVRSFLKAGAMAYRRKGEPVETIAKSLRMAIASRADEQQQHVNAISA